HPLVGRVLVNRIWLHHFGRAIVETPADFGMLGMRPTHPELLDWLADEFFRQGWSLKRMHRLIMTSAVYRQSSVAGENAPGGQVSTLRDPRRIDSENSLYWHFPLRRLEAEALRDRMLVATARLDPTLYGPAILVEENFAGQVMVKDEKPRKSIY